MNDDHWDYEVGDPITQQIRKRQPKQSRTGYVNSEATKHLFVDDIKHLTMKLNSLTGYVVIMLAEDLCTRTGLSMEVDFDFEANLKEEDSSRLADSL